jgi:CDP-diglyceride synthetase
MEVSFLIHIQLYDSLVWSIISYGAAIWGTKEYSCINAVQNRAMRFYLGVGKYTPNLSVIGDMGWKPSIIRQ